MTTITNIRFTDIQWKGIGKVTVEHDSTVRGNTYYFEGASRVCWWYNRVTRLWTIYSVSSNGFQLCPAKYAFQREKIAFYVNHLAAVKLQEEK